MYISDINLENFQIEEWSEISNGIDISSYSNFEIQNHLDDYFRFFGVVIKYLCAQLQIREKI